MLIKVNLHHHGEFKPKPALHYFGGVTDVIEGVETDELSCRDLEDFSKDYKYNPNAILNFKVNGQNFEDGVRALWDDNSFIKLIELAKESDGRIDLYVDHKGEAELLMPFEEERHKGKQIMLEDENQCLSESDESDEDFVATDDECESESFSAYSEESHDDEELADSRSKKRSVMEAMSREAGLQVEEGSEESQYGSDELRTYSSSSEDENAKIGYYGPPPTRRKSQKPGVYNFKGGSDATIKFYSGMKFVCMDEFRKVIREYGMRERRGIRFGHNDTNRCQIFCEDDCPFYMWVTRVLDTDEVQIRTLRDDHLCTKPFHNKLATVDYLAERYGDKLRKNPTWKMKEMEETIRQELEIEVSKSKILRVRKQAMEGVAGSLKEHYARVWEFGKEIIHSNPKNTVKIMGTRLNEGEENKFKRIYICYHSLKIGWRIGCRPILGLDGCFLKTITGGQLLSAIGRDGNNQMFPVAYAVVEGENQDSWRWFIDLLRDDLELTSGYGLTIISDQQKGLDNAVKEFLPDSEHRYCSRHLYANLRKKYPSQLVKRFFWQAACATYPMAHHRAMKQIEKLTKDGHEQLKKLDAKKWSKAFFATTSHSDNVENNMSECFNAWIINERYLPMLSMLQEIHFKLMNRMRTKKDEMLKTDIQLCPRIKRKLDKAVTDSREWRAVWDGSRKFQVKSGTRAVTVDLIGGSCDCRVYDLTGIPCAHAIAAIHERREQPLDYVSVYYRRERYLDAYRYSVEAIRGEEYWDLCDAEPLLPPDIPKKLRGRPKKLRRREAWEGTRGSATSHTCPTVVYNPGRIMHCSYCKQPNHKRPTCPDIPRDEEGNIIEDIEKDGKDGGEQHGAGEEQHDAGAEQIGSTTVLKEKKKKSVSKLPVKRKAKSVVINEAPTQQSQIIQTPKPTDKGKGKGKEKIGEQPGKGKSEMIVVSSPNFHYTPNGLFKCIGSQIEQPRKKTVPQRQSHSEGQQPRRSNRIRKKKLFSNTEDSAVNLDEE